MLPIDLLSILPLPQVVILTVISGSKRPNVMNLLKVFVIVQNVPRITRMYPFFTKARSNSAKLAETTWVKAPSNLLLYMLASH
ncbi:probable cyclic nucleotide-gated ion channel 10 [Pistacia vera]|uniref:probable cyclic nucleotide-gated ion channel 10 n=1 Tax=Pistacia vera TaxID=55513 RepID=UPI0012634726|nr:probable cyclic nucleotide-gated ion channel 10 [Pistacia vera]